MATFEKTKNKTLGYKCDECGKVLKTVYVGSKNIYCGEHLPEGAVVVDEVLD